MTVMRTQSPMFLRWILFVSTSISLFFVPWKYLGARLEPLPASAQGQVDRGLEYGFSGIVAYAEGYGDSAQAMASGWHNVEGQVPARVDALFKIASVTKVYQAVALVKLALAEQINLDGSLADYLPEWADRIANSDQISVRMLVQHRSGIPNYTDTDRYWEHPKERDEENLALVLDLPADFEPGTQFSYSNTNYLLLGMIMDRIVGESHFNYLKKQVLVPHGLVDTYYHLDSIPMERLMSGYYVGYEGDLKYDRIGGVVASARDVGRFFKELNEGTLLHPAEQNLYESLYPMEHTGLIPGYQTIVRYDSEHRAVLVLFTNTVNFDGDTWAMSEALYARLKRVLSKSS